jgi:dolichol-phosphate mannosyltransferase
LNNELVEPKKLCLLSIVIPAHNEESCLAQTISELHRVLCSEQIPHEIIVVNDNSSDATPSVLEGLKHSIPAMRVIHRTLSAGYGLAVRCGLEAITGDAVAIYMADASDSPTDLVRYYRELFRSGADCVFGSRFLKDSHVSGYPLLKRALNRMANTFIRILFGLRYNDLTNAFKLYRSEVIQGLRPFLSHHFNLTVELPLKAIVRGYSYSVIPNDWTNRKTGESKLRIKEMGSRYLFIVLYCLIEKWLCRGDYLAPSSIETKNPR